MGQALQVTSQKDGRQAGKGGAGLQGPFGRVVGLGRMKWVSVVYMDEVSVRLGGISCNRRHNAVGWR